MSGIRNVMMDIETLGTEPGCVVLSIGLCEFDPMDSSGGIGERLHLVFDQAEQRAAGLTIDPETDKWWSEQPPEARVSWQGPGMDVSGALHAVTLFVSGFDDWGGETMVWSQGANFDPPIMEYLFNRFGVEAPWAFYQVRDTRTVYQVFDFDKSTVARDGVHHDAMSDAVYQSKCVSAAIAKGVQAKPGTVKRVASQALSSAINALEKMRSRLD